ncbi:FtsX-like permease family protein [candidate division KSB1 bacterium]|jgi:putative ABC transport system permease protein|nr:FtsX-like permease family protein [candidate division KSB1 bacterium]
MNWRESLSVGLEGLKHHKLRSFLTALGIIFGVGAVIAMLSIGEGAKQEALEQIQLMGMKNIIIDDVPIPDTEEGEGRSNLSQGLTLDDAHALQKVNPMVDYAVPQRKIDVDIMYGRQKESAVAIGTTPGFEMVMNYFPQAGGFFTYDDLIDARRVCVLGSELKENLFFFQDAIGQQIKVKDQWYTVVGVMTYKPTVSGSTDPFGDLNSNIYVPVTALLKRFPMQQFESEINRITVMVNNEERVQETANMVQQTMQRRHQGVADFNITIPEALLKQRQKTQQIFNIVMGAIAGISLLVGGIGIMNIMLASILERTREIGIRRAVGATRLDVLGQFLVEAVVLAFVGGIVGVFLGFALTKIIAMYAGWKTLVSIKAIILAFSVSAAVGIIFGLYPARQAARLDPIVCLRYE